jgi:protocatechuate 3,4-dioxygenase beta subunit
MFIYRFRFAVLLAFTSLLFFPLAGAAGSSIAQADTPSSTGSETDKKPKLVDLWQPGDGGQRMNIRGRVTSLDGTPLGGITISIRQADGDGDYSDRYSTTLLTDAKGRYQFGSVVPGNYVGVRHVHIGVYQSGYRYFDTQIHFKGDPNLDGLSETENAIFLEESTVNGETIFFGRFDIVLVPG